MTSPGGGVDAAVLTTEMAGEVLAALEDYAKQNKTRLNVPHEWVGARLAALRSIADGRTVVVPAQGVKPDDNLELKFDCWLKTVCFQKPTPEARDLAWAAAKAFAHPTQPPGMRESPFCLDCDGPTDNIGNLCPHCSAKRAHEMAESMFAEASAPVSGSVAELLKEARDWLKSVRVFVTTRERIYPVGEVLHDELIAKLDAALSGPVALKPEWLPIEGAPMRKDVLVAVDGGCVVAFQESTGTWCEWSSGTVSGTDALNGEPTHWMPLPSPPQMEKPADGAASVTSEAVTSSLSGGASVADQLRRLRDRMLAEARDLELSQGEYHYGKRVGIQYAAAMLDALISLGDADSNP